MTKEEQDKMIQNGSSMIGAAQGPLNLGSGVNLPAFPNNFSSINPQPNSSPVKFGSGGTAVANLGGASVSYPSSLGLAGGAYGQREMGAMDFAPMTLPQPSGQNFGNINMPQSGGLPFEQGPLSMNVNAPRSAEAQGRQAIQLPSGTIYATQEQAANLMTPSQSFKERTPEQQQALISQMQKRGADIRQSIANANLRGDRSGYYAFRQGLEERRAAEALTPSFGGNIGRDATMRGAQALVQAERWRQVAGGQREAMSREPISAMGMEFRNVGMGQVAPILGSQQSQPWQFSVAQSFNNSGLQQPASSLPSRQATQTNLYSSVGRPVMSPELSSTTFGERVRQEPFRGLMTAIGGPQPRRRSVARNVPTLATNPTYIPFGLRA